MLDSPVTSAELPRLDVSHRHLEDGVCVVAVGGELDLASAPTLKSALRDLLSRDHTRLVLELSGVSHMDSTGLGVLVGVQRRLPAGGLIAIAAAPANVRALFELTGLDRTFKLFSSLDDASAHVRGSAAARPRLSLSPDGALVLGLASTAIPFADSPAAEAERWLRVLRLHGDAGRALTALGLGEAPLVEIAPTPEAVHVPGRAHDPRAAVASVTEHASRIATERASQTVGTADLLLGVMAVYGEEFDRVLTAHGGERSELIEHLRVA